MGPFHVSIACWFICHPSIIYSGYLHGKHVGLGHQIMKMWWYRRNFYESRTGNPMNQWVFEFSLTCLRSRDPFSTLMVDWYFSTIAVTIETIHISIKIQWTNWNKHWSYIAIKLSQIQVGWIDNFKTILSQMSEKKHSINNGRINSRFKHNHICKWKELICPARQRISRNRSFSMSWTCSCGS